MGDPRLLAPRVRECLLICFEFEDHLQRRPQSIAPGGSVVWTSTTPIAQNCSHPGEAGPCYGVQPECVAQYNEIALELLGQEPSVVVNDLWAEVNAVCGVNFTSCSLQHFHDVHATAAGRQFTAIKTAQSIAPLLGPSWRRLAGSQDS